MIELELKLEVKGFSDKNLVFESEKHVKDIYYDTKTYDFLKSGNFLRNRNDKSIDFKLNIGDMSHTFCKETNFSFDKFKPSQSVRQIFEKLGINYNDNYTSFEEFILVNNLCVLAVIDKTRKDYTLDKFIKISLDDAKDIGKFLEVEIDLPDDVKFDKDKITAELLAKLIDNKIIKSYKLVKIGYVELYLKKHNKKAFNLGLFK